jgi:hypothetical protein
MEYGVQHGEKLHVWGASFIQAACYTAARRGNNHKTLGEISDPSFGDKLKSNQKIMFS